MFNKEELHVITGALIIKFRALEKVIKVSNCQEFTERKRKEQDGLLTLVLKTINLSDTAQ